MPTILCPITNPCLPDLPGTNFSSYDPDAEIFGSVAFPVFNPNNPIGGDTGTTGSPPGWTAPGCTGLCYSAESQEAADLCAIAEAYVCTHSGHQPADPPPLFFSGPASCSLPCPDGSIFTWNVPAGAFVSTSQDLANQLANQYACRQAAAHLICISSIPTSGCVGTFYEATFISIARGAPPFTFAVTAGALPPGLTLTAEGPLSATLTGYPTDGGNYTFTIQALDADGNFLQRQYTISVLGISNLGSVPSPSVGVAYTFTYLGTGGTGPYTFDIDSGTLPAGLVLSPEGVLSGTATTAGPSFFTIAMTDSTGSTCNFVATLTVVVGTALDFCNLTWAVINDDDSTTAHSMNKNSATVSSSGANPLGAAGITVEGTLTYNGVAVNCTVSGTSTATPTGGGAFGGIEIDIYQDGVLLFTFNPGGTGAYSYNFTINDTGGADQQIRVDVGVFAWNFPANPPPGFSSLTANFSPNITC